MISLWQTTRFLRVPLDTKIDELASTPYTISYVIRKRLQVENLNDLPKEKRPTDEMIWEGTSSELEEWLEKVFGNKPTKAEFIISEREIEG